MAGESPFPIGSKVRYKPADDGHVYTVTNWLPAQPDKNITSILKVNPNDGWLQWWASPDQFEAVDE